MPSVVLGANDAQNGNGFGFSIDCHRNDLFNPVYCAGYDAGYVGSRQKKLETILPPSRWALSFGQYDDGPKNLYNMSFT